MQDDKGCLVRRLTRLSCCLVLAGSLIPTAASAVEIQVTTTADTVADDGSCSLREAVIAANTDTASGATAGECAAGSGADTILLPAGLYKLTIGGQGEDASEAGDLDVTGGSLTITGAGAQTTTIDANRVDRAIEVIDAAITLTVSGITIRNGQTTDTGGGIQNAGTLVLDACSVTGNSPDFDGGGIANSGTLAITNSTISSNTSGGDGAGIESSAGTVNLRNCTISGNFADGDGGGLSMSGGTMTLSNVTIASNTADFGDGGGVSRTGGTLNANNSIIAGNTDTDGEAPDCNGTLVSQGYNIIQKTLLCDITGITTGNKTGQNPQLELLQDNGGPTDTRALPASSVAIDAGNPAAPGSGGSTCQATDQRGQSRPLDGNGDGSATCDIGAFERVQPPTPTPTPTLTPTQTPTLTMGSGTPSSGGTSTPTPTITATSTISPTPVLDPNLCYAVGYANDTLVSVNKRSKMVRTLGPISGTSGIGAVALSLAGKTMYAAVGGQLGTLDLSTRAFTPTTMPFGTGSGLEGDITFDNVTGLSFDPKNGVLYGVHQRTGPTDDDILFRIDPSTGAHVPLAFDDGFDDYVTISGCQEDIADIAIDKKDGEMFAISNTMEMDDELATIEKDTGDCFSVGSFANEVGDQVDDMGGLSFHNDGQLYGSSGANSATAADKFWKIDKETGDLTGLATLGAGGDFKALACPFAGCPPVVKVRHVGIGAPGATISYRFKWMNRCQGFAAPATVVTDTLPSDLDFISVSAPVPVHVVGNSVTFNVGDLTKQPAGLATIQARIKTTVGTGRTIENRAVLTDSFGREVVSRDLLRIK